MRRVLFGPPARAHAVVRRAGRDRAPARPLGLARSRTKAWRVNLERLPRSGPPRVFVAHQVNITALTGYLPASGEALLLKLLPGGGFERVAERAAKA